MVLKDTSGIIASIQAAESMMEFKRAPEDADHPVYE
jgi:hypothetical protein